MSAGDWILILSWIGSMYAAVTFGVALGAKAVLGGQRDTVEAALTGVAKLFKKELEVESER